MPLFGSAHAKLRLRTRTRVTIVHVRHDQPATIGSLPQGEREFPDIRPALLLREAADDIAQGAIRREGQGAQRQQPTTSGIVLLDLGTSPDRGRTGRKNEPVFSKKGRQRSRVLALPGCLVIRKHTREFWRERNRGMGWRGRHLCRGRGGQERHDRADLSCLRGTCSTCHDLLELCLLNY